MSVTTDLSRRCHPSCLVCGSDRSDSLSLRFEQCADGSVTAKFDCSAVFQGYPDRLHGGVVAMLLDAAMTHCLFSRNIAGLTAKLNIRYHRAVMLGVPAVVRAALVEAEPPLYYLESDVMQDGSLCVAAKGTFWDSACGNPENQELSDAVGRSDPSSPSVVMRKQRSSP